MSCDLNNDRLLIVNYKGQPQWNNVFKPIKGKKAKLEFHIHQKITFNQEIFHIRKIEVLPVDLQFKKYHGKLFRLERNSTRRERGFSGEMTNTRNSQYLGKNKMLKDSIKMPHPDTPFFSPHHAPYTLHSIFPSQEAVMISNMAQFVQHQPSIGAVCATCKSPFSFTPMSQLRGHLLSWTPPDCTAYQHQLQEM